MNSGVASVSLELLWHKVLVRKSMQDIREGSEGSFNVCENQSIDLTHNLRERMEN